MSDANERRERLDRLADEFVRRCQAGEHPAIDDYADSHPDLADDIRRLFPTLVPAEGEAVPSHSANTTAEQPRLEPVTRGPLPAELPSERLGGYRLLREVGRGGMGVVYEAVEEDLGRHVALKVLPPGGRWNPLLAERFRREARAAARLH